MVKKSLIIFIAGTSALFALPQSSSVQTGGATVTTATSSIDVSTTSTSNIINWSSFSLASGESITFNRTGSSSSDTYYIFNKVTGSSSSTIDGSISAGTNGIIYLVNPNGVIIGANGTVVTGGFLVSSLDLTGTFLENIDLSFTGTGTLTVNGTVTATSADAIFLGYRVVTGSASTITAQNIVGMGAGSALIYKPNDSERIYIETAGTAGTGTGLHHQGTANGISVMMKADGNIYALAINQAGTIQATSCTSTGGKVKLVADPKTNGKGAIEMTGSITRQCLTTGAGTEVEIYGHTVALQTGSSINVSGASGGNVTIGTATTYPTANVYVHSGATITSSGTTGNGGVVTMYGGTSLLYLGSTTTSSASGNGGNINLTSLGYLGVNGSGDPSSTTGTVGTFAITGDLVKVGAAANHSTYFAPSTFVPQTLDSVITETSIEGILALGNMSVTGVDIDVETVDINWSTGNKLTLNASSQLDITKSLVMTGTTFDGTEVINLTAPIINVTASTDAGANLTSGDIAVTASNTLLLTGASTGTAQLTTADGDVTVAFGQHLKLRGSGGSATISGETTTINSQTAGVGDISIKGEACGTSTIVGSTAVVVGTTTSVDDIEIIAGACGSGLESGITGGTITLTGAGDLLVKGGASGTGNIGIIKTLAGTQKNITITAHSIHLLAGAAGTNNSARIVNSSNDGTVTATTTLDLQLTAGGTSTTSSIAEIYSKSNTFTVGRDFQMNGGGGVSSLASVYGYSGNTINATGDIGMYSGSALYTHAKIVTQSGDIALTSSKSIYMYTGTSIYSDVFVTTEDGTITYDATHDIRMRASCSIPNKAYIYSHGTDGHVTLNAVRDISRIGNTEILARGTGIFTAPTGTYTFSSTCQSDTINPVTPSVNTPPPVALVVTKDGNHIPNYHQYEFAYELFYRMRYFGLYDWYLFHSTDFWIKHTFTAP